MKNQRSHTHHGEGSVFHLTTPNRRKSWVAQVTLGGGKKKHVYCTSQKEANTARRQMLHEVEHAMVVEGSQQTVAAYFKQWLATKRLELKNSTYETYRKYTAWFILPALGHIRLQKLTSGDIQVLYVDLLQRIEASTVRQVHRILRRALNAAVRSRKIVLNPALAVTLPRVTNHELAYLTP